MTRRRRMAFRTSLAETKRANLAAMEAMSHNGMSDAGRANLEELRMTVKPKVTRGKRMAGVGKLESEVQREIIAYLLRHPSVVMVERINSGAVYGAGDNFIRFHHLMLPAAFKSVKMRVVDLNVMMFDGKRMVIEVKREGWKKPSDQREVEQYNYLIHVTDHGGCGIFASCVEDVENALITWGYYDAHP